MFSWKSQKELTYVKFSEQYKLLFRCHNPLIFFFFMYLSAKYASDKQQNTTEMDIIKT